MGPFGRQTARTYRAERGEWGFLRSRSKLFAAGRTPFAGPQHLRVRHHPFLPPEHQRRATSIRKFWGTSPSRATLIWAGITLIERLGEALSTHPDTFVMALGVTPPSQARAWKAHITSC